MRQITLCTCFILTAILSSCISTSYKGKSFDPTNEVVVFYSRSEIDQEKFKDIGQLEVTADTVCSSGSIMNKIREEATARGADAALIHWFDSRFIIDEKQKNESCSNGNCHHEKDQYKYKKLVKVILLKAK